MAPGPSKGLQSPDFTYRSPFSPLPASSFSASSAYGTVTKKTQGPPRTPSPLPTFPTQLSSQQGPSGRGDGIPVQRLIVRSQLELGTEQGQDASPPCSGRLALSGLCPHPSQVLLTLSSPSGHTQPPSTRQLIACLCFPIVGKGLPSAQDRNLSPPRSGRIPAFSSPSSPELNLEAYTPLHILGIQAGPAQVSQCNWKKVPDWVGSCRSSEHSSVG